MTVAVAHRGSSTPDGVLVQEAAAGSGVSYGDLYDRYATQVFNYCLRLTGSPEDAADATQEAFVNVLRRLRHDDRPVLEFSSYLFTAARHESYGLMRERQRVRPADSPPPERDRVADVEADPERAALLRDEQDAVRDANARLEPRHREVLALREVAGRSYDEVGEIMGISENAAAQLIWRARAKLRGALTAGAVASVVATSEECETAQLLLNRVQDGEAVEDADRVWLEEHLEECGSCQTANRMLLEAGASYRLWMPVALLAGMRTDTLTRAGELVGADWSQVATTGEAAGATAGGTSSFVAGAVAVIAAVGIATLALTREDEPGPVDSRGQPPASTASDSAQNTPGRDNTAAATEPGAQLAAARAPRSSGAPAVVKRPTATRDGSDGTTPPKGAPLPPGDPQDRPAQPPGDGQGPRADPPGPRADGPGPPTPSDPKADPPPSAGPRGPGPGESGPPGPAPSMPPDQPAPPGPEPAPSECSWPGGGGGPAGCPPGHGGIPPGHGGTPPGRGP